MNDFVKGILFLPAAAIIVGIAVFATIFAWEALEEWWSNHHRVFRKEDWDVHDTLGGIIARARRAHSISAFRWRLTLSQDVPCNIWDDDNIEGRLQLRLAEAIYEASREHRDEAGVAGEK